MFRYPEDIFSVCGVMTDESLGDPVTRLAVFNDMMLEMYYEKECLEHTYAGFLSVAGNTERGNTDVDLVERPWRWQTCTEFGWYQTTNQAFCEGLQATGYNTLLDRPHIWIIFALGVL